MYFSAKRVATEKFQLHWRTSNNAETVESEMDTTLEHAQIHPYRTSFPKLLQAEELEVLFFLPGVVALLFGFQRNNDRWNWKKVLN